jgi:plasmid stabilization system protein ParE
VSRYLLTKPALADLEEVLGHIADDRPSVAERVGARFLSTFEALAKNPQLGHVRADLTRRPVRFWPLYSYIIVYRADATPLQILRVLSGCRDIAALLRTPEGD